MPQPIALGGCTAEPLANYLKALGVLRLLVEQKQDLTAKGYWQDDCFWLLTDLSRQQIQQFFLDQYTPTPLVAPWNGSTGFYAKDNQKTIAAFRNSQADRLTEYRGTIATAQAIVNKLGLTSQPKDDEKRRLIAQLRNQLPDAAVKWLDACVLVTASEGIDPRFPPLAGTGGNDGNYEFSRTFMQQFQELFDLDTGAPKANTDLLLQAALWGETVPNLEFTGKIGQFNPIAAGGANAAPGRDADSRVNPWDSMLLMEGIMLFAAAATRRYETETGTLAYPFMVRSTTLGYGSASEHDKARAEFWTPLWTVPVGLGELQALFGEGRAKVNGRSARDGIDFARAIATWGVNRGISEFVRWSFQERNGLSYFAIPLGRFWPHLNPQVERLAETDAWLLRLKERLSDAPASLKLAYRQLEQTIVELARDQTTLLEVLVALGEVEKALDRSLKFTKEKGLLPISLPSGWLKQCNDGSVEFRLALALANIQLRTRFVRVRQERFLVWSDQEDGITTWTQGGLTQNLLTLLRRQEIEMAQSKPQPVEPEARRARTGDRFQGQANLLANFDDITAWIVGTVDDARIEAIARGLSLIDLPPLLTRWQASKFQPPFAYAVSALVHYLPRSPELLPNQDQVIPRVPELLARLSLGDSLEATTLALQRLRASNLQPALRQGILEPEERTKRMGAALAFHLSPADLKDLLKQCQCQSTQPKQ